MANSPPDRETLLKILEEAIAQLQDIEYCPFSFPAFQVLKEKISKYIVHLVEESERISRYHQTDIVSATHVEWASERLIPSKSRRFFKHLGTLGGILLGVSLSSMLSMIEIAQYSTVGTFVSASLGIIGSFMVALHIAKDE